MTEEWYRWYGTLTQHPYESLSLDYDERRFFRIEVRSLMEATRHQRIKEAWAAYRAAGPRS